MPNILAVIYGGVDKQIDRSLASLERQSIMPTEIIHWITGSPSSESAHQDTDNSETRRWNAISFELLDTIPVNFVAFISAEAVAAPNLFEKLIQAAESDSDISGFAAHVVEVGPTVNEDVFSTSDLTGIIVKDEALRALLAKSGPITDPEALRLMLVPQVIQGLDAYAYRSRQLNEFPLPASFPTTGEWIAFISKLPSWAAERSIQEALVHYEDAHGPEEVFASSDMRDVIAQFVAACSKTPNFAIPVARTCMRTLAVQAARGRDQSAFNLIRDFLTTESLAKPGVSDLVRKEMRLSSAEYDSVFADYDAFLFCTRNDSGLLERSEDTQDSGVEMARLKKRIAALENSLSYRIGNTIVRLASPVKKLAALIR